MRAHLLTVTCVWAPGSVDGALELVMREEMYPAAEGGLS
jgi:hypothetical protein